MTGILNKIIQGILLLILVGILGVNLIEVNAIRIISSLILVGSIFLVFHYKDRINIPTKVIYGIAGFLLVGGIVFRVLCIYKLDFILESDFALYYNTAVSILYNNPINDAWYLSFNGYVYVFSSILATIFKIFGDSINSVLLFNLACQIGTVVFIKKFLDKFIEGKYALLLSSLWFILPNVIAANLLVSTETLFIFICMIFIYVFFKTKDITEINFISVLKYILVGSLMSLCNNIRPVMLIFVIAIVIDYIINSRKLRTAILYLIMFVSLFFTNFIFSKITENGLNEPSRSGALEWSLYFGSNYQFNGGWNELDASYVSKFLLEEDGSKKLLQATLQRYYDIGPVKTSLLFAKKFKHLYSDINGNLVFVEGLLENRPVYFNDKVFDSISFVLVNILLILNICNLVYEIKNNNHNRLFIQLFFIGYVLANLLVVLNGRYSFPVYLLLILLVAPKKAFVKTNVS